MSRFVLRAGGALALAALLGACDKSSTQPAAAALQLSVDGTRVDDQGGAVTLTFKARDAEDHPGTGVIQVRAAAGRFSTNNLGETSVQLDAQGEGRVGYSCSAAVDANCRGSVTITATWGSSSSAVGLVVGNSTQSATPDGGTPDAGGGGTTDAGTPDAGAPQPGDLAISVSKTHLIQGVGDSAQLSVSGLDAGAKVTVAATGGALVAPAAGGAGAASLELTASGAGLAQAQLLPGTASGAVTVTVSASGAEPLTVQVHRVASLSWAGSSCEGQQQCTVLGLKGSGINEQGRVSFLAVDELGGPVPGLTMGFTALSPPAGATLVASSVTGEDGVATTSVNAGTQVGMVSVRATATGLGLTTLSPAVGIRGARPSNHAFTFHCERLNIDALVAAFPPADRSVACTVGLVDRFNNPVGVPTPVNFSPEAGNMTVTVTTTPWSGPGTDGEGAAPATFNTRGQLPLDVAPLAALPAQWSGEREAEPSRVDGPFVRNPRDGFVTLLAYARGEEYFQDDNANGLRDPGELFIDQGEAFVDENDNGQWDEGEFYVDDSPSNGQYDAANGTWDGHTTIWASTHILYTGLTNRDEASISPEPFADSCLDGVPKAEERHLAVFMPDDNLNRPASEGFSLRTSWTGTAGGSFMQDKLAEAYGFGVARALRDAASGQACTPASDRCEWRLEFGTWSRGAVNTVGVSGLKADAPESCVPGKVIVAGKYEKDGLIHEVSASSAGFLQ